MKNLELNVVRFEAEDVITTSVVCNKEGSSYKLSTKTISGNSLTFDLTGDGNRETTTSQFSVYKADGTAGSGDDLVIGQYYHIEKSGQPGNRHYDFYLCDNADHHDAE